MLTMFFASLKVQYSKMPKQYFLNQVYNIPITNFTSTKHATLCYMYVKYTDLRLTYEQYSK